MRLLILGAILQYAAAASIWRFDAQLPAATNSSLPPSQDPFYDQPSNISSYQNGDVIRVRDITSALSTAMTAVQIFYKTTNNFNASQGTVTTVFVPPTPANPPRIVSYQVPEDATQLNCAPSYAYQNGSASPDPFVARSEGAVLAEFALAQNAYMVSSDFEGPQAAWLVGLIEAHGVLDGIRAAINHYSLNNASIVMYGYSGGAHATVWAVERAAIYAPELNIVGSAQGGTPIDPTAALLFLNASPFAGLALAGLVGYANGYPAVNQSLYQNANANGTMALSQFQDPDFCAIAKIGLFTNLDIVSLFDSTDYLLTEPLLDVSRNESLLMNVSTIIPVPVPTAFPRYIFHSQEDDIVPYAPDAQYVEQQCSNSTDANIIFVPYLTGSHVVTETDGRPGALGFMAAALNGTVPSIPCGGNYTFTYP